MAAAETSLSITEAGGELRVGIAGPLTVEAVGRLDRQFREALAASPRQVVIDATGITALDSAGAWILRRTSDGFAGRGIDVRLDGLQERYRALVEKAFVPDPDAPDGEERPNPVLLVAARAGEAMFTMAHVGRDLFGFFGLTIVSLLGIFTGRTKLRFIALVSQLEYVGLNAVGIVSLLCFLVGVVLAYMGSLQLERFGAAVLTVNLVGVSVLREIGVLLTAIIVAGRSGSAFTAQIGTMKVNQEVDALETLGLSPVDVLVLPRLIALFIALPILVFIGDIAGLAGGAMIAVLTLDLTIQQFLVQLKGAVDFWDFGTGIVKAPVFAYVIAVVGCHQGLQVSGSAESVGFRTTKSVVESIFIVIVLDALFAIFFAEVGI
ncbi:MlaE family lipid ABC transporter permease subunit [Nisaea acidiphila]|uniref:MlaE family lipid ABC transporter permease subunit n=1 Tax=Nisaea acidiphila TaxID=1862145 RepID=A0A9J7AT03_9PROT|nr:MlaE family lipid ABC transporter permease subunit [Nisaea acidiphila]UUX49460.1 MlaE family lipid ABC transporter permease subunit [Nisaea acidiphila]